MDLPSNLTEPSKYEELERPLILKKDQNEEESDPLAPGDQSSIGGLL